MLRHQQVSEEQTTPAAQVRVSPQELVEAISAVESRNDAERRHVAETVALGEAVEQLGLHTTAEELLAEIEQRRLSSPVVAATEVAATPLVQKRSRRRLTRTGALLLCSLAANLVFLWIGVQPVRTPPSSVVDPTAAAATADALKPSRPPQLQQLASVPENTLVHSDYAVIHDLAQGKNPAQVTVDIRPEQLDENGLSDLHTLWSLIKKDGHLYVHGWTSPESALRIVNGHRAFLGNHTYDKEAVTVDIPIERFKNATPDAYSGDSTDIPIGVTLPESPSTGGSPAKTVAGQ